MRVFKAAYYPNSHLPYASAEEVFTETKDITAIGKLFVYCDFVTRYLVKIAGSDELHFVRVSAQEKSEARWLTKIGKGINPASYPTRDNPIVTAWAELKESSK